MFKIMEIAREQLEMLPTDIGKAYDAWAEKHEDVVYMGYTDMLDSLNAIEQAYKVSEVYSAEDALAIYSILTVLELSELNEMYLDMSAYADLKAWVKKIVDDYFDNTLDALGMFDCLPAHYASAVIPVYRQVCRNGAYSARWLSEYIIYLINGYRDELEEYDDLTDQLTRLANMMRQGFIETEQELRYINDLDITVGFILRTTDGWVEEETCKRTPLINTACDTVSCGFCHGDCTNGPEGLLDAAPCLFDVTEEL